MFRKKEPDNRVIPWYPWDDYKLANNHAVDDYRSNDRVIDGDGRHAIDENENDAGGSAFDFLNTTSPRLLLGRNFRAHVNECGGWAYCSEHYVQGVREARERQSVPRIDALVEPPRPTAVSREQARQRRYTPPQDYDEIRNYESASSSSNRGLGTDSEEDAGIFQHLQSQQRQWRDRESARVYEAKHSEREETEAATRRAIREREHRRAEQRFADARALEHSTVASSKDDIIRARKRDKSGPRKFRESGHRDTSESSVESDISGRKKRDVKKTDEGQNKARQARKASRTLSFATDSDSEINARNRRKRRSSEAKDGIHAGKLIRAGV